jgi:hypothetical protein
MRGEFSPCLAAQRRGWQAGDLTNASKERRGREEPPAAAQSTLFNSI